MGDLDGRVRVHVGSPARIAGAGIQLSPIHVLTCWHVTASETAPAVEADGRLVAAEIVRSRDIGPRGDGDVVVLRTEAPLTSPPARLADRGAADLDVRIIGYPPRTPTQVQVQARLTGPVDPVTGWRQLDRLSGATVPIERGFSGAGVFDGTGAVVGMVVARSTIGGQTVGWMLPAAGLHELLPDTVARPPAAEERLVRSADRIALARLLEEVPVVTSAAGRALVVETLPPHIRRSVRLYGQLGLDAIGLVRTALEFDDGLPGLYEALRGLEAPENLALRRFHDHAVALGLLPAP